MSARAITGLRVAIATGYAVLAWALTHDGITAGEFGALFVVGAVLVVIVLAAGWIANGKHQDGDPWDGEW